MPQRVTATPAALELVERLRAPDLPASPHDDQLGALAGVPVVIDGDQNRRWQHPSFHLDVAPGAAGGFSLEALEDLHLTAAPGDPPR